MASAPDITLDVALIGGGVAGLWLLNLLRGRGYRAVLLESNRLGGVQTLASQGIVHGGFKYTLGGRPTPASEAVASMPERWRRCLAGEGEIDLSAVGYLAREMLLFAGASGGGKLTTYLASKLIRGRVRALEAGEHPAALAARHQRVYALPDFVLDTPRLLHVLLAPVRDLAYTHRLTPRCLTRNADGWTLSIGRQRLHVRTLVLTAGAGNQHLLDTLEVTEPHMQIRPLQQVVARAPDLLPLWAHCLTGNSRPSPRLTITSHRDGPGWLWYLGGQLAEDGAAMTADELVAHARIELASCVPWIDWRDVAITTLRANRAEPATPRGRRPDSAFVAAVDRCLVCWPTKLTLVPDLGDRVLELLDEPSAEGVATLPLPLALPPASIAAEPWRR